MASSSGAVKELQSYGIIGTEPAAEKRERKTTKSYDPIEQAERDRMRIRNATNASVGYEAPVRQNPASKIQKPTRTFPNLGNRTEGATSTAHNGRSSKGKGGGTKRATPGQKSKGPPARLTRSTRGTPGSEPERETTPDISGAQDTSAEEGNGNDDGEANNDENNDEVLNTATQEIDIDRGVLHPVGNFSHATLNLNNSFIFNVADRDSLRYLADRSFGEAGRRDGNGR